MVTKKRSKNIDTLLEKAKQFEDNGDYPAAARQYQDALDISTANPGIWGLLGWTLLHAGDLKEALTAAKKMRSIAIKMRSKPLLAVADCLMARIHQAAGRKVYAERYYQESLDAQPRSETYVLLADFWADQDHTREARECYQNALAIAPDNTEAHYNLALGYLKNQDYENAIKHLRRIIDIDPQHVAAIRELVRTLWQFRSTGFKEALYLLREAILDNPRNAEIHLLLAYTYKLLKKQRDAEGVFRTALENISGDSRLHWGFACFLNRDMKNPEAAEYHFQKALALDPDNGAIHYYYGEALQGWEREEDAREQLEAARKLGYENAADYAETEEETIAR
ncbi:MAG: tetratricopeptide repeat protein [Calditrichaeota bacterium]|nr:tetratricopeptide repeat protein [Calditrichota bacterium]